MASVERQEELIRKQIIRKYSEQYSKIVQNSRLTLVEKRIKLYILAGKIEHELKMIDNKIKRNQKMMNFDFHEYCYNSAVGFIAPLVLMSGFFSLWGEKVDPEVLNKVFTAGIGFSTLGVVNALASIGMMYGEKSISGASAQNIANNETKKYALEDILKEIKKEMKNDDGLEL